MAERVERQRPDVLSRALGKALREGGFAVLVLRVPMQHAMLARLPWQTMMVVSLLSERRGPSGGLHLRSHQRREWDAQGAMPGLSEGKVSVTRQVMKHEA